MKLGIFGGTFDPPHLGHLSAMTAVQKRLGLKNIYAVPAYQNPLKAPTDGAEPQQRLEMLKLATESWSDAIIVDPSECAKANPSYTVDTVRRYRETHKASELFLVIGLDNLASFGQWKEPETIIQNCNLVVVSRPGFDFPTQISELPQFFKDRATSFDFNVVELNTGRTLEFLSIQNSPCSGTEIRKRLRAGQSVTDSIPLAVESYIREKNLYKPIKHRIGDDASFVRFCAKELNERKGFSIRALDVRGLGAPCDYIIVASGSSSRHATSLAQNLVTEVKKEFKLFPQSFEGAGEGRWVLVDYGLLIVHVFYDFIRQDYQIESLYPQAKEIHLELEHPQ